MVELVANKALPTTLDPEHRAKLAWNLQKLHDQCGSLGVEDIREKVLNALDIQTAQLGDLNYLVSLSKNLGSNRYLFSLALAASEVGSSDFGYPGSNASDCVVDFMERCANMASRCEKSVLPSRVIELILEEYESRHRDRKDRCFAFRRRLNDGGVPSIFRSMRLQRMLLWHLSVIGQPVIVEVLATCPIISRAMPAHLQANRVLELLGDVLEEMVERCLIFRVQAKVIATPGDPSDCELSKGGVRYGVHKLMQRFIFSSLGSPMVEYPRADQYTVSLYASQPNDLPVLTPTAHGDLRETIATLSAFPDGLHGVLIQNEPNLTEQEIASHRLRAAFAIWRSVYSVSVTSRFDASHAAVASGQVGESLSLLDDHRHLVRWVYQQARAPKSREVFYAEELAWLCNEAGVISCVQGKLNDSIGLYDLAEAAARRFEPKKEGSVRTRIRLNRCVSQIDRGNLINVEAELKSILSITDETYPLRAVSVGYLGLVHHVRGQHERASACYSAALFGSTQKSDTILESDFPAVKVGLLALNRSRACSIFYRHWGDLERVRGNRTAAMRHHKTSITLAQESGHEDVRHGTLVSILRTKISEGTELATLQSQIAELEQYASMMGIPRLSAEALELRARLHRKLNDMTEARAQATRALQIAAQHDLRLRKSGILVLLGYIHQALGDISAAIAVTRSAMTIARNCDHHLPLAEASLLLAQLLRQAGRND